MLFLIKVLLKYNTTITIAISQRDWLLNADKILDPDRKPNMMTDEKLLGTELPLLGDNANGTIGDIKSTKDSDWRTKFATNAVPEARVPISQAIKGHLKVTQNKDVVHSFLCDRYKNEIKNL